MLTEREIKALEPKENKKYLVVDGEMMSVLVYPSGKNPLSLNTKTLKHAFTSE